MDVDRTTLKVVSAFMIKETGVHLDDTKQYLINSRLKAVAKKYNYPAIAPLAQALKSPTVDKDMKQDVISALTTHETLFYRDKHPFETLGTKILPELAEANNKHGLRIWCGAVSTGQEAYSLAMTLLEYGGHHSFGTVDIIATDLCRESIAKAEEGVYSKYELGRGVSQDRLTRFFTPISDDTYQVKNSVRSMIKFGVQNLMESWWVPRDIHVILLRNVLIYFDNDTKVAILKKAKNHLNPQGYLFLGGSETVANLNIPFSPEKVDQTQVLRPQALSPFTK